MTTVANALRWAEDRLQRGGIRDGARLEATLLLGHTLGASRAAVLASLSESLSGVDAAAFRSLIERRARREPLQYLRRRAPFLDFELEVGPGVFIPRPETELVVDKALEHWLGDDDSWAVDVGTGSGAIAIALARARPGGRVLSIDRSATAIETAARNAARLGVADRIVFVRSDLLAALDNRRAARAGADPNRDARIAIVACNPPYVADGDVVDPEVRDHEPRAAWSSGPTGLEVYEALVPPAARLLAAGGCLILELGAGQDDDVSALLAATGGFETPRVDLDYRGIGRVLTARAPR